MSAAFNGRWERRGPILVPIPETPKPVRVPRKDPDPVICRLSQATDWTEHELRSCHAAHVRGDRDPYTVAGHREYDRRRKAVKRMNE